MTDKNPYNKNTPEWQLWDSKSCNEALVLLHRIDSAISLEKAFDAHEQAIKYAEALAVLDRANKGFVEKKGVGNE